MLPNFTIPTPTGPPTNNSYPTWRQWLSDYTNTVYNYLTQWIQQQLIAQFNTLLVGFGADIASAATINITNLIHQVTGSNAVSQINGPLNAVGPLMLYARDGFSIGTSGNCTPAATIAAGHGAWLAFHTVLGKWVVVTS